MIRPHPISTLFPYTTLFRSVFALLVVQPAALAAHDTRVAAAELPVEDVAVGITVRRHSSPCLPQAIWNRGKLRCGAAPGERAPCRGYRRGAACCAPTLHLATILTSP